MVTELHISENWSLFCQVRKGNRKPGKNDLENMSSRAFIGVCEAGPSRDYAVREQVSETHLDFYSVVLGYSIGMYGVILITVFETDVPHY